MGKERKTYLVYFRNLQISDGWKKDIKDTFILSAQTYTEDQAIGWAKTLEAKKSNGYKEYQGGNELCYVRNYFIAVEVPQPEVKPQPPKQEQPKPKVQKETYVQMTLKDYGL